MSHIDQGPLSHYNSLVDSNLSGYFTNTRMRRHLLKAGLINRHGEIVSENTYRLNMMRKEYKQHVKDMLAQAIVHKTLDLERMRQAEIRKKLEEIAKIELVRRVRMSRHRKRDADILYYINPRSESRKRAQSSQNSRQSQKIRSTSVPTKKKFRPISSLSSNYDEDDEDEVEYLDDDGKPIKQEQNAVGTLDSRQLYDLDSAALRKYAMNMAKADQKKQLDSPYLVPQVPLPPKSPRREQMPRSARRYRHASDQRQQNSSPPRPFTAQPQGHMKQTCSPRCLKLQPQSKCTIEMKYLGSRLRLARDQIDKRQEILVEQQHCGGNTLIVFKEKLEAGEMFSFTSHRHTGYPFALTIYIDGKCDCRVSTCCEYRHQGCKLFGKKGHFSFKIANNAFPCYKCQFENSQKRKLAKSPKKKNTEKKKEENGVDEVDTAVSQKKKEKKEEEDNDKHPIIPVEKEDTDQNPYDDDDFEQQSSRNSSRSSSKSRSRSSSSDTSSRSGSSSASEKLEKIMTKQYIKQLREKSNTKWRQIGKQVSRKKVQLLPVTVKFKDKVQTLINNKHAQSEEKENIKRSHGFDSNQSAGCVPKGNYKQTGKPARQKKCHGVDEIDTADEVSDIESEIATPGILESRKYANVNEDNTEKMNLHSRKEKLDRLRPDIPRKQPSIVISTSDGEVLDFSDVEYNYTPSFEQLVNQEEIELSKDNSAQDFEMRPEKTKTQILIRSNSTGATITQKKFEEKIIAFPMAKTGENKYINKQLKKENIRRIKKMAKNRQDRLNESAPKDLSPREKVIRGYPGDSSEDENVDIPVNPIITESQTDKDCHEIQSHETVEIENSISSDKILSFSVLAVRMRKRKEEAKLRILENNCVNDDKECEQEKESVADSTDAQKDPLSAHSTETFHKEDLRAINLDDSDAMKKSEENSACNEPEWKLPKIIKRKFIEELQSKNQPSCHSIDGHTSADESHNNEHINNEHKIDAVPIIDSQAVKPILFTPGLVAHFDNNHHAVNLKDHTTNHSQNAVSREGLKPNNEDAKVELTYFTNTDQNIDHYNPPVKTIHARVVTKESERYMRHRDALEEPPAIVLAHNRINPEEDLNIETPAKPMTFSVLHPGDMYHLADLKRVEKKHQDLHQDTQRMEQETDLEQIDTFLDIWDEDNPKNRTEGDNWDDLQVLQQINALGLSEQTEISLAADPIDYDDNESNEEEHSESTDNGLDKSNAEGNRVKRSSNDKNGTSNNDNYNSYENYIKDKLYENFNIDNNNILNNETNKGRDKDGLNDRFRNSDHNVNENVGSKGNKDDDSNQDSFPASHYLTNETLAPEHVLQAYDEILREEEEKYSSLPFSFDVVDVSDQVDNPPEPEMVSIDTNLLYPRRPSITEPTVMRKLLTDSEQGIHFEITSLPATTLSMFPETKLQDDKYLISFDIFPRISSTFLEVSSSHPHVDAQFMQNKGETFSVHAGMGIHSIQPHVENPYDDTHVDKLSFDTVLSTEKVQAARTNEKHLKECSSDSENEDFKENIASTGNDSHENGDSNDIDVGQHHESRIGIDVPGESKQSSSSLNVHISRSNEKLALLAELEHLNEAKDNNSSSASEYRSKPFTKSEVYNNAMDETQTQEWMGPETTLQFLQEGNNGVNETLDEVQESTLMPQTFDNEESRADSDSLPGNVEEMSQMSDSASMKALIACLEQQLSFDEHK